MFRLEQQYPSAELPDDVIQKLVIEFLPFIVAFGAILLSIRIIMEVLNVSFLQLVLVIIILLAFYLCIEIIQEFFRKKNELQEHRGRNRVSTYCNTITNGWQLNPDGTKKKYVDGQEIPTGLHLVDGEATPRLTGAYTRTTCVYKARDGTKYAVSREMGMYLKESFKSSSSPSSTSSELEPNVLVSWGSGSTSLENIGRETRRTFKGNTRKYLKTLDEENDSNPTNRTPNICRTNEDIAGYDKKPYTFFYERRNTFDSGHQMYWYSKYTTKVKIK